MRYTDTHVYFFGDRDPFSNFYRTSFEYEGNILFCSEQAFMIEKALQFDPSQVDAIVKANTPYQAKMLGRKVRNYNESVWRQVRYDAMVKVLKAKFANEGLKKILLDTGDRVIVEGSPYDAIWGVKLAWDSNEILDERNWKGSNLLGKALMEVREYYKNS